MTDPIWIAHDGGRYPVRVAPGGLAAIEDFVAERVPDRRLVVITDRTVARLVDHGLRVPVLVVPPGETSKSRGRWAALTDRLLELGYGRDSAIVALGGGVVGDLAGFVAATYLRGIPWVQVPTTLLAMVDASIGGKTGVDTPHGKNLVGAFHPPAGVLTDPAVLRTLRPREVRTGLVEAIKHGLVADADYLAWIDRELDRLLDRSVEATEALIRKSIELKGAIVGADERESGSRAVLNAGHTVGHALEQESGYRLSHGDAVALGLVVEAILAGQQGLAPLDLPVDLVTRFRRIGCPLVPPPASADAGLLATMARDKKNAAGVLQMALPRAPGALLGAADRLSKVREIDVRQALGIAREMLEG